MEAELTVEFDRYHGLEAGDVVATKTAQFVSKYDPEVNTHRYFVRPAGMRCVVTRLGESDGFGDALVYVQLRCVDTREKFRLAPWLLEKLV